MRKKKKRGLSGVERASIIVIAVALMAVSFGAGWFFGVQSTKFRGDILLVNDKHRLAADYVPEGLVNLYQNRHSFRLASSDITLTREDWYALYRAAGNALP